MPLPNDLYEKDAGYRIRVCTLVERDPILGLLTQSHVIMCDGCERPIWFNPNQQVPDLPDEYKYLGTIVKDLRICMDCMKEAEKQDPQPDPEGPIFLRPIDQLAWEAMKAHEKLTKIDDSDQI